MEGEAIPNSEGGGGEPTEIQPKNPKASRYYYRHREQVLERRKQKKLEDPEYQAKIQAKEEAKKAKEAEKKAAKEQVKQAKEIEKEVKRAKIAKLLGVDSPGLTA